jgi:hypothetical protein
VRRSGSRDLDLVRARQAAVLPDAPHVVAEQHDPDLGQDEHVQDVEADERRLVDAAASYQDVPDCMADERDLHRDVRADRDRPERELIPGQQVA